MADDAALIWEDDVRARRPEPVRKKAAAGQVAADSASETPAEAPLPGGRISLREAHHQFGVPATTLASWARSSKVDATKEDGKWMVTPSSVAAALSQRHGGKPRTTGSGRRSDAAGSVADSTSMLVPRDAWDKLMDQLGNLHEAGQMLAEARERAGKAETEARFLRERLAEMREERDELKGRSITTPSPQSEGPGLWKRLGRALKGDSSPS